MVVDTVLFQSIFVKCMQIYEWLQIQPYIWDWTVALMWHFVPGGWNLQFDGGGGGGLISLMPRYQSLSCIKQVDGIVTVHDECCLDA